MKKFTSFLLTLLLFFTSFLPFFQTPLTPQKAYAEENCIYYVYDGQANIHMLYQSQQLDPESSLYYLRARYYDPLIGRFISKDPVKGSLTLPQSQNPYAYALNNPVNLSDPSGEYAQILSSLANVGSTVVRACAGFISKVGSKVSNFVNKTPAGSQLISNVEPNRMNHILQEEHAWGKVVSNPNDWNQVSQVINKVLSSGDSNPGKAQDTIIKTLQIGKEWVEVQLFTDPNTGVTSIVNAFVQK
jgi:RHS repeat-associated protein